MGAGGGGLGHTTPNLGNLEVWKVLKSLTLSSEGIIMLHVAFPVETLRNLMLETAFDMRILKYRFR